MNEINADKYLEVALDKKRRKDESTFAQFHEGENHFFRKMQLRKGGQGEVRDDAVYYWSEHEGMRDRPAGHRFPVYRTEIPRVNQKNGNMVLKRHV